MCLDQTGRHQVLTCAGKGKPWFKCDAEENGSPCLKEHHRLLHGSKVAYWNAIYERMIKSWRESAKGPAAEPEEGRAPTV